MPTPPPPVTSSVETLVEIPGRKARPAPAPTAARSPAEILTATQQGVERLQPLLQLLDPADGGGALEELADTLQQLLLGQRQLMAVVESMAADLDALRGRTARGRASSSGGSASA